MIVHLSCEERGDSDEDGSVGDSTARAAQGETEYVAAGGHHGQRVHSVLVGGSFQTVSCDGEERTVNDSA